MLSGRSEYLKYTKIMLMLVCVLVVLPLSFAADFTNAFIIQVDTTNSGSSNNSQFTLPLRSGYTYNFSINWSDGSSIQLWDNDTSPTHDYASSGEYNISIIGDFPTIYFNNDGDRQKLTDIYQWGNISWQTFGSSFYGTGIVGSYSDSPDLSNVTDMSKAFESAGAWNGNLNDWNVSTIQNMSELFRGNYNIPNISNWDTSSVVSMNRLFFHSSDCGAATFNASIGSWDVSQVTDMEYAFYCQTVFDKDISGWNTSSVTTMANMFDGAREFNQPIGSWDVSQVTDMSGMFYYSFLSQNEMKFDQDLSGWNVSSLTTNIGLSNVAISSQNMDNTLEAWSESGITGKTVFLYSYFGAAQSEFGLRGFRANDILENDMGWNIQNMAYDNQTYQPYSFSIEIDTTNPGSSNADEFTLPLRPGFDYDFAIDWGEGQLFNPGGGVFYRTQQTQIWNSDSSPTHTYGSSGQYNISIYGTFPTLSVNGSGDIQKILDIVNWGNVTWSTFENSFNGATNLTNSYTDVPDLSNTTSVVGMFENASSITVNVSDWNISNIQNFSNMLTGTNLNLNLYDSLLNGWVNTVSSNSNGTEFQVGSTQYSSAGATARDTLVNTYNWTITDGGVFTPFLTTWDTRLPGQSNNSQINISLVSGYTYDFLIDWGDNQTQAWSSDTYLYHNYSTPGVYNISIVGQFPAMTSGNWWDAPKIIDIVQWGDVRWETLNSMFYGAVNLIGTYSDTPDISNITSLNTLFRGATNFTGYVNDWNVSNITDMSGIFNSASSFNSSMDTWDVSSVTSLSSLFQGASAFNQNISGWNTSSVTNINSLFYDASSFNQDVTNWDVTGTSNFLSLFHNATSFDQDLSSWNVSSGTNFANMFNGARLSTLNYSRLLNGWSQLDLSPNEAFHGGNSNYSFAGAVSRDRLLYTHGWTITDGSYNDTLSSRIYNVSRQNNYQNQSRINFTIVDMENVNYSTIQINIPNTNVSNWSVNSTYNSSNGFFNASISNFVLQYNFTSANSYPINISYCDLDTECGYKIIYFGHFPKVTFSPTAVNGSGSALITSFIRNESAPIRNAIVRFRELNQDDVYYNETLTTGKFNQTLLENRSYDVDIDDDVLNLTLRNISYNGSPLFSFEKVNHSVLTYSFELFRNISNATLTYFLPQNESLSNYRLQVCTGVWNFTANTCSTSLSTVSITDSGTVNSTHFYFRVNVTSFSTYILGFVASQGSSSSSGGASSRSGGSGGNGVYVPPPVEDNVTNETEIIEKVGISDGFISLDTSNISEFIQTGEVVSRFIEIVNEDNGVITVNVSSGSPFIQVVQPVFTLDPYSSGRVQAVINVSESFESTILFQYGAKSLSVPVRVIPEPVAIEEVVEEESNPIFTIWIVVLILVLIIILSFIIYMVRKE